VELVKRQLERFAWPRVGRASGAESFQNPAERRREQKEKPGPIRLPATSSVADAEIVCAIPRFGRRALMHGACLPARALPPKPESEGCSSRQPKQYKKLEIRQVRVFSSSDKLELYY
jgi:hypothetical protein